MTKVKYNYKTTLPKEANAPSVFIDGDSFINYKVTFNIIGVKNYLQHER